MHSPRFLYTILFIHTEQVRTTDVIEGRTVCEPTSNLSFLPFFVYPTFLPVKRSALWRPDSPKPWIILRIGRWQIYMRERLKMYLFCGFLPGNNGVSTQKKKSWGLHENKGFLLCPTRCLFTFQSHGWFLGLFQLFFFMSDLAAAGF